MRFRKLRIAWSVGWGLLAVLLIALWVRSIYFVDGIKYHSSGMLTAVATMKGAIGLSRKPSPILDTDWSYLTAPAPKQLPKGGVLFIPLWLVTTTVGGLSIVPWVPYRFSLRTLLIGTTLVAVVLGLVVWLR
jgi:hypothetical protein